MKVVDLSLLSRLQKQKNIFWFDLVLFERATFDNSTKLEFQFQFWFMQQTKFRKLDR